MMNKFFVGSFFTVSIIASASSYADNDFSCKVEVAVATPPIQLTQNVSFNVTSVENSGPIRSITLKGGSAPQFLDVACFHTYIVSATAYPALNSRNNAIGECILKAGNIAFNYSGDTVSVVFPNDFICNN
ncbi:hypothetical protein [Legionella jamestowniensis]|uniref:Secreted protein n=1 Tax=Legionella jamestowniensis TaxID=455 RepID=A0A0W0ULC8_9GAMM|nr:hypothetical protein [Legionella jamestowniensis]KTD08707.1 hypothetical protein Ljam_2902 [Legionella jamestowniensis]OCH96854.1 hypothetical protein A8135_04215 [Legionella jamestowniensis]SFL55328.1 hypothetical protein SAMN02746073_0853 [Legionella jamestowniensis DSM 19215]